MSDFDFGEVGRHAFEQEISSVYKQGLAYTNALLSLNQGFDTRVQSDDLAVGFDVGAGPELVAFGKLGFSRALATNQPSAAYDFVRPERVLKEVEIRSQLTQYFPRDTIDSNLGVVDVLHRMKKLRPKLVTMLRVAPRHFETGIVLLELVKSHQFLCDGGMMVISSWDDHHRSREIFDAMYKQAGESGIDARLIGDESIVGNIKTLGSRILMLGT